MFCLFSISLMLICWNAYTGPSRTFLDLLSEMFHRYGPGFVASLILLPIAMMDVVRLSNRFVGPVMRLRGALQDMAAGRPVKPLNFRDDDFWCDLAGDLNEVAVRLNRRDSDCRESRQPTEALAMAADDLNSVVRDEFGAPQAGEAGASR
jgi:hypothetical protein